MGFVWYQAREDIKRQYARTRLGPIWIVLTQFVAIMGIGLVFFTIFDQPLERFLPYISASIISWNVFSVSIATAPTIYTMQSPVIQSFKMPFAVFPVRSFLNILAVFAHGMIIHVAMMLFFGISFWYFPVLAVSLVLITTILYPIIAVLGILGARYRDLAPALVSVMYVAFLVTPVIWDRFGIGLQMVWIVDYNPFYHMIEIMRRPMLGAMPTTTNFIVCFVLAAVSLVGGEWFFRRFSRPLPFWV